MSHLTRTMPVLFGIGLAAIAASAGLASATSDTLRCDIVEHSQNGMRSFSGLVTAPKAITGQYSFAVKSQNKGNTATINQGGAFAVPADAPVPVGQIMIDASARYSLDFSITVAGDTIDCTAKGARLT